MDQGPGPRGTPTVDGDRLYVLTENGDLACLKTDGSSVWQLNILKEFRGEQLPWLISESPLVDGPHLVVTPGGRGAGMVKLDKMTGKTVWTSKDLSDAAAYSSVVVAEVQGVRTYMTFTANGGVGIRASDGKLMFRYSKASNYVANVATPVYADNKVFFASAYDTGGGLVDLTVQDGEVKAKEVYFTRNMKNHHGGMVLVDGYLYGFNDSILTCLEFATGKMMWRDRSVGKGSVTYADGRLYIQSENNVVGLVEATPSGYQEKGRFQIPDRGRMSWAHPAISDGPLYVRNQDTLLVYDVKAPNQKARPGRTSPARSSSLPAPAVVWVKRRRGISPSAVRRSYSVRGAPSGFRRWSTRSPEREARRPSLRPTSPIPRRSRR